MSSEGETTPILPPPGPMLKIDGRQCENLVARLARWRGPLEAQLHRDGKGGGRVLESGESFSDAF